LRLIETEEHETVLHVGADTSASSLGACIAEKRRAGALLVLHAIGPAAVGQAVKAVPIANSHLAPQGEMLLVSPSFITKHVPNVKGQANSGRTEKTLMCLRLVSRRI
jgi:stage V sporulation protein SpoVS